jgi:hypothetical protein
LNCEERERDGGGEKEEEKPLQECFHQAQGGGSLSNHLKLLKTNMENLKKSLKYQCRLTIQYLRVLCFVSLIYTLDFIYLTLDKKQVFRPFHVRFYFYSCTKTFVPRS